MDSGTEQQAKQSSMGMDAGMNAKSNMPMTRQELRELIRYEAQSMVGEVMAKFYAELQQIGNQSRVELYLQKEINSRLTARISEIEEDRNMLYEIEQQRRNRVASAAKSDYSRSFQPGDPMTNACLEKDRFRFA